MTAMFTVFAAVLSIVRQAYGYNNGVGQLPAMGWNTWCSDWMCGSDVCSDTEVRTVAQAMIENGMKDAGWDRLNLDDCWEACWRSEGYDKGQILPAPERFPHGMRNLTDYLHALGFKFGLYTSAGTFTCNPGARPCIPPGSYGHYAADAQTFAWWGVDYVKLDWCGKELNNYTLQQTEFSDALNNTGRPIWFEACRGYPYPNPPYLPTIANSWRIDGDHTDNWQSTLKAINNVGGYGIYNVTNMSGPHNWAYMDFLMTGGRGCPSVDPNFPHKHCPGQTDTEYITEFSVWAIAGSPLIVATDVRNMTEVMKKVLLNTEVIAINQQNETPAGSLLSQTNCDLNVTNACRIFTRHLNDGGAAVLLLNVGESEHSIEIEFRDLGMNWNNSTSVKVRDLWEHQDLGSFVGSFSSSVAPHGVVFTKMTTLTLY